MTLMTKLYVLQGRGKKGKGKKRVAETLLPPSRMGNRPGGVGAKVPCCLGCLLLGACKEASKNPLSLLGLLPEELLRCSLSCGILHVHGCFGKMGAGAEMGGVGTLEKKLHLKPRHIFRSRGSWLSSWALCW